MKPDISEFSYGYALTSEIVQTCGAMLAGAPVFPSLIAEGSLGYDLELPVVGRPIFLQFKLSDHMVRSTAEGSDKIPVPHYRMHLRPLKHSDQHDLLRALESTGKKVYYAAPEFHASADLNDAYLKNEMILRTAFFRPNAIGKLPDNDEHFVCFSAGSPFGYVCSEPVEVEKADSTEVRDIFSNNNPDDAGTQLPARLYLQQLADELVTEWSDRRVYTEQPKNLLAEIRATRGPREYLGWVAQTLFDCTVFIRLQRKDEPGAYST